MSNSKVVVECRCLSCGNSFLFVSIQNQNWFMKLFQMRKYFAIWSIHSLPRFAANQYTFLISIQECYSSQFKSLKLKTLNFKTKS